MNIGLDLDNTIIDYSESFIFHAKEMGLISENTTIHKQKLKNLILKNNDHKTWQMLQGIVYGKGLKHAKLYPGVYRFLWRAKQRKHKITIVSHKTKYGHYDISQINLRNEAILFLKRTKLFKDSKSKLIDKVFFCNSQNLKIKKIKELKLDLFVDDLPEILERLNFLDYSNKVFFNPLNQDVNTNVKYVRSFDELSKDLFSGWSILDFQNKHLFKYKLSEVNEISGQGNSKILLCKTVKNQKISLKIYPTDIKHNRINSEFLGLSEIYKKNKNVIKPLWKNVSANLAAYQWIDGTKITKPNVCDIQKALEFLKSLHKRRKDVGFKNFTRASASCISGYDIEKQIKKRFDTLIKLDNKELKDFLNNEFLTSFQYLINRAKVLLTNDLYFKNLGKNELTLSPSDFGFHNIIKQNNNNLIFLDFEYFGWDDPLKLISDFFFHPGHDILNHKIFWLKNSVKIYNPNVLKRLPALLPLYGLCWSLIFLNEFKDDVWENRIQANKQNKHKKEEILKNQLSQSKTLLLYINNFIKTL